MASAGWVHRDISAGNILGIQDTLDRPWRVQVSDLEYAKRFTLEGGVSDTKTVSDQAISSNPCDSPSTQGTPAFMAHEIIFSKSLYIFYDEPDLYSPVQDPSVDVVHVHTYQHDIESLWWLPFWLLMCKVDHDPSAQAAEPVFRKRGAPTPERERAFVNKGAFYSLTNFLKPGLEDFWIPLNAIRTTLFKWYCNRDPVKVAEESTYGEVLACHLRAFEYLHKTRNVWGPVKLVSKYAKPPPAVIEEPAVVPDSRQPAALPGSRALFPRNATTSSSKRKSRSDDESPGTTPPGSGLSDEISASGSRMTRSRTKRLKTRSGH